MDDYLLGSDECCRTDDANREVHVIGMRKVGTYYGSMTALLGRKGQ